MVFSFEVCDVGVLTIVLRQRPRHTQVHQYLEKVRLVILGLR